MSTDLETMVAQLSADIRSYERAMKKAQLETRNTTHRIENQFNQALGSVERRFQRFGRMAAGALAGVGIALSGRAMANLVRETLQLAETLDDTARTANMGVEAFQEWRFAATQNGVAVERFDRAVQQLNGNIGIFINTGGGPAARALRDLGLEADVMSGRISGTENVLMAIAERLDQIPDAAQRAGLASQLMGQRYGREMTRILSQGSEAIREYFTNAREMGLVLREDVVQRGAEANAKMRALGDSFKTQLAAGVLEAADEIVALMDHVRDLIPQLAQWGVQVARIFETIRGQGISGSNPVGAADILRYQAGRASAGEFPRSLRRGMLDNTDAELQRALGNEGLNQTIADLRALRQEFESVSTARDGSIVRGLDQSGFDRAVADYFTNLADRIVLEGRNRVTEEPGARPQRTTEITDFDSETDAERARRQREAEREAERQRQLANTRERLALERERQEAEARGDEAAAQRAQRQLDLMSRMESYRSAEIEDYASLARLDQRRLDALEDDAEALERINSRLEAQRELQDEALELEVRLASLRGDQRALDGLERELYIRQRINDLMERDLGLTAGGARQIAETEADAMLTARHQGEFRQMFRRSFRDGILAALDDNAKEAFSNWMRDAATQGLGRALDAIADQVFDLFKGGGGGGGLLGSIAGAFGFGGARAFGGPVQGGKSYLVGERGVERFTPTTNGVITPMNMPSVSGGSGPSTTHIHLVVEEGAAFATRVGDIAGDIAVTTSSRMVAEAANRMEASSFNGRKNALAGRR